MKKAFIIHGWGGYPKEGWFPWLKEELVKKDFSVKVLKMPDSDKPKIDEWVSFLKKQIKKLDKETYLIGHSIGCQAILRYLEQLDKDEKVGGIIFVAPWIHLKELETEEEKMIAEPWLKSPIDFDRIKEHTNRYICIFSDNDCYVPLSDSEIFKEKLDAKIVIEKNKGHFSGSDNINELPSALNELVDLSK